MATKKTTKKKATKKVAKKATKKVAKKATKKVAKKATKKVAKKATKKAAPKKKVEKKKVKRKPNAAFMKPVQPDKVLADVVGNTAMPRTQIVKKLWDYIKKHKLQDPANKRNILADSKLQAVFGGKKSVTMFELAKVISKHIN